MRHFRTVAAGALYFGLSAFFMARAANTSSYQDWQFETNSSPTQPTVSTNSAGDASATITIGSGSLGWLSELGGFGHQTGIWDLGFQNPEDPSQCQVLLNIPNPSAHKEFTDLSVRLVYFVDGVFYKTNLAFSLPGASFVPPRKVIEALPPPFGGNWVEDHYQWHLSPSPTNISLVITGAVSGTILDGIHVETSGPPVPPLLVTSVQKSEQGLALSWTGGLPPYQIYGTTNLDAGSWETLGSSLSGTNVDIPLVGPTWFVRVGGSD